MTTLRFGAIPTDQVRTYRNGEPDGNGQVPQQRRSDGDHIACRHCLAEVAAAEPYPVLACRPFPALQPDQAAEKRRERAAFCARRGPVQ